MLIYKKTIKVVKIENETEHAISRNKLPTGSDFIIVQSQI